MKSDDTKITGTHEDGIGWAPNGHWCGECGWSTCEGCSVWNIIKKIEELNNDKDT